MRLKIGKRGYGVKVIPFGGGYAKVAFVEVLAIGVEHIA